MKLYITTGVIIIIIIIALIATGQNHYSLNPQLETMPVATQQVMESGVIDHYECTTYATGIMITAKCTKTK